MMHRDGMLLISKFMKAFLIRVTAPTKSLGTLLMSVPLLEALIFSTPPLILNMIKFILSVSQTAQDVSFLQKFELCL